MPEITIGEVPGMMYGLSANGWMDTELFELWFKHHFLAYAPPTRPLLLLIDGHSSHFQPGFVKKAAEEQIIVFCLPPHTTHLTQPLDKGCFGPLKMYWREECQNYVACNPGRVVTRYQFSELFSRAWYKGMSMSNIMSGFRITGIFPFNRHALRPCSEPQPRSVPEGSGLKYIPLFSPAPARHRSQAVTPSFSDAERAKFEYRFEEGFDLDVDPRYNLWKEMYHPDDNPAVSPSSAQSQQLFPSPPLLSLDKLNLPESESSFESSFDSSGDGGHSLSPEIEVGLLTRPTTMSKLLSQHQPHLKAPTFTPKSTARVLTSLENRTMLERKAREKKEAEELKERRKKEREAKRKEKEELQERRRREREAKQKELQERRQREREAKQELQERRRREREAKQELQERRRREREKKQELQERRQREKPGIFRWRLWEVVES